MDARDQATARGRSHSPSTGDEPPLKRQRVLACRRCRHRKQRCEDTRPCTNCQKSGDECIPTEPAPRPQIDSEYIRALEERIAELESMDPGQSLDHMQGSRPNGRPVAIRDDNERISGTSIPNHTLGDANHERQLEVPEPSNTIDTSPPGRRFSTIQTHPHHSPLGTFSLGDDSDSEIDHAIPGLITSPSTQRDDYNGVASENSPSMHLNSPRDRIHPAQSLVAGVSRDVEETLLAAYRERTQSQYPFFYWGTFLEWLSEWKRCPPSEINAHLWQGFFVNLVYSTALLVLSLTRIGKSDARTFYKSAITLLPAVLRQPNPILHAQAYMLLGVHALHRSSTHRILSLASTTMRFCVQQQFYLAEMEAEPKTPAIRLENQLRRRCFWSAYNLDRLVMYSFDIPPSIPDAMITTKLYANIDDDDLPSIAAQTPSDQELPDSTTFTSVSSSLHILQCRRIQSEIAGYTLRWDYKDQFAESLDWRIRILAEMENYKSRVQTFSDPQSKGHTSHRWLAMIYHYTLLNLYRPTKESVLGPAGDWSVQASSQACLMFRKSQMDRKIAQAWLGLLVQFQSGITLLYCFWATPPEHRTENYHSPDVSDALRACSNILAIMADRWPKADCLRDVFELLAREIPLVDQANRVITRISEKAVTSIRGKLPQVRALVVHRSILRMLDEMVSEDFPHISVTPPSFTQVPETNRLETSQTQRLIINPQLDTTPGTMAFEMPFSAEQMYAVDRSSIGVSALGTEELLEFPRMFDFDAWA
ncbi:fungal specific transcription factor domain-containing protein [Ilyonectria robusta]